MARRRRVISTFKFKPFSRRQKQVLTWWLPQSGVSDANGIICDGAIRSGKTVCMALAFFQWSMANFNGQNFGMCGKTVGSFRRNVLSVLKQMLPARGHTIRERRAENLVIVSRGKVTNYYYIFGGKDEGSQDLIQGITLAGLFCDEVALMPQSFVDQATGRCSVAGSKWWFNCNPNSPEHWFKKNIIDKAGEQGLLYLHFSMDDNLSLDPDIKKRYYNRFEGVFYRRYILGEWCVAEGLVYSDFSEENITDEVPVGAEYYVSIDYGTLNPTSMGLWAVTGAKAVRIKEYYYDGRKNNKQLTDEEYCDRFEDLTKGFEIRAVVADPSAASFIAALKKRGYTVHKAKNDVLDGIRYTAGCLKNGNIKIHRSCTDCIREFGLYRWDQDKTEDKVIKENDHAMDDVRYFCFTVMRKKIRKAQKEEYNPVIYR